MSPTSVVSSSEGIVFNRGKGLRGCIEVAGLTILIPPRLWKVPAPVKVAVLKSALSKTNWTNGSSVNTVES